MATEDQNEMDISSGETSEQYRNVEWVSTSEVSLKMQKRQIDAKREPDSHLANESEVFKAALTYVKTYAKFKSQEALEDVEKMLKGKGLTSFQVATLLNVCPEGSEDAQTFLPSLHAQVEEDDLKGCLEDMRNYRVYIG